MKAVWLCLQKKLLVNAWPNVTKENLTNAGNKLWTKTENNEIGSEEHEENLIV